MYFARNESREEYVLNIAAAEREAAALFPAIRAVLEDFDGKVLNCRLEKALRERTGKHICVNKRYKFLEITVYLPGCQYEIYFCSIELASMPDGKRIPAALMIENARERREKMLEKAAELENGLTNVSEWKTQLAYLERQINRIRSQIPYEIQDAFNLSA